MIRIIAVLKIFLLFLPSASAFGSVVCSSSRSIGSFRSISGIGVNALCNPAAHPSLGLLLEVTSSTSGAAGRARRRRRCRASNEYRSSHGHYSRCSRLDARRDDDDLFESPPNFDDESDGDEDDDDLLGGGLTEDWKAFQRRLVERERLEDEDEEQQQYEDVEEFFGSDDNEEGEKRRPCVSGGKNEIFEVQEVGPGTILLSTPTHPDEEGCVGYGLGRQFLHKSIILMVERRRAAPGEEGGFATGIVLNRGPGFQLVIGNDGNDDGCDDDDDKGRAVAGRGDSVETWQVWYGGDSNGFGGDGEKEGDDGFYCLHFLDGSDEARLLSREIVPGVFFTTLSNARRLTTTGQASPADFWTFTGHLRWDDDSDLADDFADGLWDALGTNNLARVLSNLRDAGDRNDDNCLNGVDTWSFMRHAIGRPSSDGGRDHEGDCFDDAMLREWARENLPSVRLAEEERGRKPSSCDNGSVLPYDGVVAASDVGDIESAVGTILRGPSSSIRNPYLLSDQELHKSLILIIQDDANFSVGVILNLPSARTINVQIAGDDSSFFNKGRPVTIGSLPVRYGGPYDFVGLEDAPLFFLHRSHAMREHGLGEPIGGHGKEDVIWRCKLEEATEAIARRLVEPGNLIAVNGFCMWEKDGNSDDWSTESGGLCREVSEGRLEVVPQSVTDSVWRLLVSQQLLTSESLDDNLQLSDAAWRIAGGGSECRDPSQKQGADAWALANSALRHWVTGFLLGGTEFLGNQLSE